MTPMRSAVSYALVALAMSFTAALPSESKAQAEDGKVFQDWTIRCEEKSESAAEGGCFMAQEVINNETKQPVMILAIGYVPEQKTPAAIFTLPLGVLLPPGVAIQIDQGEALRAPFSWCLPDGCKVRMLLDEKQLAAFRAGVGGKLTFQHATGQTINLPFSLKGFTAALASLR